MAVYRVAAAVAAAAVAAAAWRLRRYEIAEQSMSPALQPGDYVVAVRQPQRVRPGDVVVFEHPDRPGFTVVKRAVRVDAGLVTTAGDNRPESRDVGPVPVGRIEARVVLRYWPLRRGVQPVPRSGGEARNR